MILVILILLIGILSTYFNWGWVSVVFSITLPLLFIVNVLVGIYGAFKRKYFCLIGAVCYLLIFHVIYTFSNASTYKSIDDIRILSFNTRGFSYNYNGENTRPNLIRFIDTLQADIVVLQESNFPITRKFQDYPYNFNDLRLKKGKSLLSIYSKYPIVHSGYIDFPNTRNNAIYTDIVVHNDTIRLYNVHLQSHQLNKSALQIDNDTYKNLFQKVSHTFQIQVEQSEMIRNHRDSTSYKTILCGDFNTPQYALPYRILKQDLSDSFLEKGHGLGTTYNLKGFPLRLDYILTDQSIEILNHENFNVNLSDHEPVLVTIKL